MNRPRFWGGALAALLLSFVADRSVADDAPAAAPEALRESEVPEHLAAEYALFAARCGKCHPVERVLERVDYDAAQWRASVRQMSRRPDAAISSATRDSIQKFLDWYAARNRLAETSPPPAPSAPTSEVRP